MVCLYPPINPEIVTYASTVDKIHGRKLLKDGYRMVMIDGRHGRRSVKLRNKKHMVSLACHFSFMYYSVQLGGNALL